MTLLLKEDVDRLYNESILGYQVGQFFLRGRGKEVEGLSAGRVHMQKIDNTRKKDGFVDRLIEANWEKERKQFNATDSPRPRFEEVVLEDGLTIKWSDDSYKNHVGARNNGLPKEYLCNPWTINAVMVTKDGKVPLGVKNPKNTDQGAIRSITPIGFVDYTEREAFDVYKNPIGKVKDIENMNEALSRIFEKEWEATLPYSDYNVELLGIGYNSGKNNDYVGSLYVPLNVDSSELVSKQLTSKNPKGKYDKIEFYDVNKLDELFVDLAMNMNNNPGHMRLDVGLTYGRLNGGKQAYLNLLNKAIVEVAKKNSN